MHTSGYYFHLSNPFDHLVSVFLCEGYFAVSLSKRFSLPFFLKSPVIKKDEREGKFTRSSFPPRLPSLLPVYQLNVPKKTP